MYLSRLLLDPAHCQARIDTVRLYEMHRTISRAFPANMTGERILWRLEWIMDTPLLIVQSQNAPVWERLPAGYLLSHEVCAYHPAFVVGQQLRFRLRANPTRRLSRSLAQGRDRSKRVALYTPVEQLEWLERKGDQHGFVVERAIITGCGDSRDTHRSLAWHSVQFDGELTVTHAETFAAALCSGIGSAKGFGFGLLSVWD